MIRKPISNPSDSHGRFNVQFVGPVVSAGFIILAVGIWILFRPAAGPADALVTDVVAVVGTPAPAVTLWPTFTPTPAPTVSPVVEQVPVEVTRVVVEQVPVEVTRVVERGVPYEVTRVVERGVPYEVTRVVEVKAAVPTPTPTPTLPVGQVKICAWVEGASALYIAGMGVVNGSCVWVPIGEYTVLAIPAGTQ